MYMSLCKDSLQGLGEEGKRERKFSFAISHSSFLQWILYLQPDYLVCIWIDLSFLHQILSVVFYHYKENPNLMTFKVSWRKKRIQINVTEPKWLTCGNSQIFSCLCQLKSDLALPCSWFSFPFSLEESSSVSCAQPLAGGIVWRLSKDGSRGQ